MLPWFFNVNMDVVMKEVKMGMGKLRVRFLHAGDLVYYGESEEDLKVMVGGFVEVRGRRSLKANADKSKVLGGKDAIVICVGI